MIVVVGISHHTAPIEVRERIALSTEMQDALMDRLVQDARVAEAFVVSTCNRVEVFAVGAGSSSEAVERCARACRDALTTRSDVPEKYFYSHVGLAGVRHLVQVASSLDSLVVGEPQILGQLKQGFERAREHGAVGPHLHRAFSRAVQGAKRVRTETQIGAGQVSVPSIAIDLARQIFGDLKGHSAVLIGAGEMGQSVARLLRESGARLTVVGRNQQKIEALAQKMDAEARLLTDVSEVLVHADVVVTSTSSEEPVVRREQVAALRKARRGRNLFIIDLAVPRDVEPEVGDLDEVFLYNIDDLSNVAVESAEVRRREADRASEIVEETVRDFQRWASGEQATPVIKALRTRFRSAFEVELARSLRGKLKDLDPEQRAALAKMLDASLNRVLHAPTMRLRELAASRDGLEVEEWSRVLTQTFALDEAEVVEEGEADSVRLPSPAEILSGVDKPETSRIQSLEEEEPESLLGARAEWHAVRK